MFSKVIAHFPSMSYLLTPACSITWPIGFGTAEATPPIGKIIDKCVKVYPPIRK